MHHQAAHPRNDHVIDSPPTSQRNSEPGRRTPVMHGASPQGGSRWVRHRLADSASPPTLTHEALSEPSSPLFQAPRRGLPIAGRRCHFGGPATSPKAKLSSGDTRRRTRLVPVDERSMGVSDTWQSLPRVRQMDYYGRDRDFIACHCDSDHAPLDPSSRELAGSCSHPHQVPLPAIVRTCPAELIGDAQCITQQVQASTHEPNTPRFRLGVIATTRPRRSCRLPVVPRKLSPTIRGDTDDKDDKDEQRELPGLGPAPPHPCWDSWVSTHPGGFDVVPEELIDSTAPTACVHARRCWTAARRPSCSAARVRSRRLRSRPRRPTFRHQFCRRRWWTVT